MHRIVSIFLSIILAVLCMCSAQATELEVIKLGQGELGPVLATDEKDVIHLVYFKGNAQAGDIHYRRRSPQAADFSKAILVNSMKDSAMIVGAVRAPDMAVSSDGIVHIAWMSNVGGKQSVMYARSNKDGSAFSKQKNLMQRSEGLDAGVSIATFGKDKVYVIWTAHGKSKEEKDRLLFAAYSKNAGKTFSQEAPLNADRPGICGCCGIDAAINANGEIIVLYRSAGTGSRDMTLAQGQAGKKLNYQVIDQWQAKMCPMSSMSIAVGDKTPISWQTQEQVLYAILDKNGTVITKNPIPSMGKKQKHSKAVVNSAGDVCLAWTEGTGWNKGGRVLWQLNDATGKTIISGRKNDLAAWSMPALVCTLKGNFLLVY
ncbi:MAG: hypothetical protein HRU15_16865 [Planctomycetes bacterium]|nr:hypothetical protein [Planctomycetota bacterium]